MNRLVAFGCSFTYGHGLDDAEQPGTMPSNFAWPALLAYQLNLTLVNNAVCGSSNLSILNSILNSTFLEDDSVIVMWSFFTRDMIFYQDRDNLSISNAKVLDLITKQWSSVHNDYDLMMRSWIYIHHAYWYLRSKNINFYFLHAYNDIDFISMCPSWAKDIKFLPFYICDLVNDYPLALDGFHPGTEAHRYFASIIYNEIIQ